MPEERRRYPHLTGLEYLEMVGQLRGLPARPAADRIGGLLRLFGLDGDRHVAISSYYSKGMRQKVLPSAALMHNPELILLDEPFSGLEVGSALIFCSLKSLLAREQGLWYQVNIPLLVSSLVMMCFAVMGIRVVFSMQLALRANWIFRMTMVRGAPEYLAAIHRSLLTLAVGPVWAASSAVLFLSIWPLRAAVGHLSSLV